MGRVIGVDLGTVFSVVARATARGRPRVVLNRDGRRKTRSVVLFDGAGPLVPGIASDAGGPPAKIAELAGCSLGDPTWRFRAPDGRAFRSEEISALILRRLKEDAELALGHEVTDAVLTVPACFDDASRRATVDAGRIAGLTVRRVLNAPTAAALAYGRALAAGSTVLVYALGGGSFDASVLRVGDREIEVLATRGDRRLGGLDWDNTLMRLLNRKFRAAGGPDLLARGSEAQLAAQLRDKAELAKHCLSTLAQIQVVLCAGSVSQTVTVRRAEFEVATARLLDRTRDLAQAALEAAGLTSAQIDEVVPAGGPTRMPMVRSMLKRLFGKFTLRPINPDEVVALGAAAAATHSSAVPTAELGRRLVVPAGGRPRAVREVSSHGLGALARDPATGERRNVIVIPANTPLPARGSGVFATIDENQTRIDIDVTQGDGVDPAAVCRLDRKTIQLPARPAGTPIEIVYLYDADQVPHLEVNDLATGQQLGRFEVRNMAAMSDAQVAESVSRIRELR
jgi:molecular chaperone DnaK